MVPETAASTPRHAATRQTGIASVPSATDRRTFSTSIRISERLQEGGPASRPIRATTDCSRSDVREQARPIEVAVIVECQLVPNDDDVVTGVTIGRSNRNRLENVFLVGLHESI